MKIFLIVAAMILIPSLAEAGSCTSYKSGSYTKTYCSNGRTGLSYKSGSYRKSYWNRIRARNAGPEPRQERDRFCGNPIASFLATVSFVVQCAEGAERTIMTEEEAREEAKHIVGRISRIYDELETNATEECLLCRLRADAGAFLGMVEIIARNPAILKGEALPPGAPTIRINCEPVEEEEDAGHA